MRQNTHLKHLAAISMADVFLSETASTAILEAAAFAHPCETGGLLLGVYQDSRPWVTHALVIPSAKASPSHYELPAGVTHALVDCARRVDGRLGYLGEWHSHPADLGPSQTDARTMRQLPPFRRRSPLLLLARGGQTGYAIEVYEWSKRLRSSVNLRRTGNLPEIERAPQS